MNSFKLISLLAIVCLSGLNVSAQQNRFTHLVFADEFDTPGLPDSSRWEYEKGHLRNHELQYYTEKRLENVSISDGVLHLTARADSLLVDGRIEPITSGSLKTRNTFSFKYGRIDVRAKLPKSLGTWAAIWLMPTSKKYGGWPASGEIDIMEHVGYEPERINYAIHTMSNNHMKKNGKGSNAFCADAHENFHVYSLEWDENSLIWLLDGRKRFILNRPENATWEEWPFDEEFYLIINNAFGGGWGGAKGVAPDELPQDYIIDYVRIYQ